MHHASVLKNHPQAHSRRRLVIPAWEDITFTSYALGGKGHGIARLMALGLPTPPALVISTSLARSYQETGRFPSRFGNQLDRELEALEKKTGKRFGDPENPLLVSVRSGAMISMPGMMETVLNVGLTKDVRNTLRTRFGRPFVADCSRHLLEGLGLNHLDLLNGTAEDQLVHAIMRVLASWQAPSAQAYRREHNISDKLGTAITIQAMVFGNQSSDGESGTGVAMSHHPDTAQPVLFGNYLQSAQGHDLVSGEMTPGAIEVFVERQPALVAELADALERLQVEVGGPVEVEFTVENGTLYFLQFRKAKLSPEATIIHLVHEKHKGNMTREAVVEVVPEWVAESVQGGSVLADTIDMYQDRVLANGTGVGNNAVFGALATTDDLVNFWNETNTPYILVRETTTPDDFERMLGAVGIITKEGGSTCHAAMVARHQGIPAVIGLGEEAFARVLKYQEAQKEVTLDAVTGSIFRGICSLIEPTFGKEVALFNKWRKLSRPVIEPKLCHQEFDTNTALNNFYMAEAMLAACTDETFKSEIRARHNMLTQHTGAVFSTYLALAVASEVTHVKRFYGSLISTTEKIVSTLFQQFTLKHRDAWQGLSAPDIAVELAAVSSEEVADFFCSCKKVFADPAWIGTSFGGSVWVDIAAVGEQYWRGDINTVTFIDRVFDLRHNTGSVFNKHQMVDKKCLDYMLDRQLIVKRGNLPVFRKWRELSWHHRAIDPDLYEYIHEGTKRGLWK